MAASPVHVVTAFHVAGGSQERALELAAQLRAGAEVSVWSTSAIAPEYRARGVRRIWPLPGRFPRAGTLILVGTPHYGPWLHAAGARRVILIHNTLNADTLRRRLHQLARARLDPELVYCSATVAAQAGLPGVVHPSPIDLRAFHPAPPATGRPFTVGRLSRDSPIKFGPGDAALFRALGAEGMRVRLMGATCLAGALDGASEVEVLPAGAEPAPAFLQGLDCFLYRTAPDWPEPYGRVIAEAMACGLPVVCHRDGGAAAELVEDGRSGVVFSTDAEAAAAVRAVRDDPALRARLGAAARARVEAVYGPEASAAMRRFYLGPAAPTR